MPNSTFSSCQTHLYNKEIEDQEKSLEEKEKLHQIEIGGKELYIRKLEELYNLLIGNTNEHLDKLAELQENHARKEEEHWDQIIEEVRNGTASYSDLMNSWYGEQISSMDGFIKNLDSQVKQIKQLYSTLNNLKANPPSPSPSPSSGGGGGGSRYEPTGDGKYYYPDDMPDYLKVDNDTFVNKDKKDKEKDKADKNLGEKIVDKAKDVVKDISDWLDKNKKHTGGIVGNKPVPKVTQIANKMFNTQANETVIKSLIGELQIPPQHIATNFPRSMRMFADQVLKIGNNRQVPQIVSQDQHYHFGDVTVKANNPTEFWQQMNQIINSHKK